MNRIANSADVRRLIEATLQNLYQAPLVLKTPYQLTSLNKTDDQVLSEVAQTNINFTDLNCQTRLQIYEI